MSYAAPPPPSMPPMPPSPPSGAARRSRTPWFVAALAALVAIAAVVALVVVLATGDDSDSGRGADRGFDSPEEAARFMVERLADGDAGAAAEAFAVDSVVDGYDFEALAERLRVLQFNTWLPGGSTGYDDLNREVRRGEVAAELRSVVRSVLVPDVDFTQTVPVDGDQTAAGLATDLDPAPLSELSVVRVDDVDRDDDRYRESLEQQAAIFGADEMRTVAMLLDTAEGQMMGGATAVRYGDDWALMQLSAPLLNLSPSRFERVTEQDYQDAVDSARGTD
ncbi:hypothetical protein ABFT23_04945 [Nocardioides sp. C4-1]|uniref:hypothetical protein n=1 Tax=Nocardioides sp. C4-1 TaxID=3151851 RepID=UPI003265C1F1